MPEPEKYNTKQDVSFLEVVRLLVANSRLRRIVIYSGVSFYVIFFIVMFTVTSFSPTATGKKIVADVLNQDKRDLENLQRRIERIELSQNIPSRALFEYNMEEKINTELFRRLAALEAGLESQPERFLSVPLLRKDLESAILRLTEYQIAVKSDIDRMLSIFMWLCGFVLSFNVGLFLYLLNRIDKLLK